MPRKPRLAIQALSTGTYKRAAGYPLEGLLKLADVARGTFYFQQKALQVADK